MEEDKIDSLIKIILYLFLAMAFFSNYVVKSNTIDFIIKVVFLFGTISLIFLYIGKSWNKDYFKAFGYVFAGSFTLVFCWFILNVSTPIKEGTIIVNLLNFLKAETIWIALLIPFTLLVLYLIVREIRKSNFRKI